MSIQSDFKPGLLIVDLQEDFCHPHGTLAVTNGRHVVHTINHLLSLPFVLKVATKDVHPGDHISFASNHLPPNNKPLESVITIHNSYNVSETAETRLWPNHCVQGTFGSQFIEELDINALDHIVEKGQDKKVEMYSAFKDPFNEPCVSRSTLAATLQAAGITHLYVAGLALDYCVKYTAIDAAREGFTTYIITEATKAIDVTYDGLNLEHYGIKLVSAKGQEVHMVQARS